MLKAEVFQNAAARHARFYLEQLKTAHEYATSGNKSHAFALFDEHWAQIQSAFAWLSTQDSEIAAQLRVQYVTHTMDFLMSRRPVSEVIVWLHTGIDAAHRLENIEDEITYLIRLGEMYMANKSIDDSRKCYERALEMAQAVGMHEAQGWALRGIGTIQRLNPSEVDLARERLHEAIAIFRALDHANGLGQSLQFLGTLEETVGHFDRAQAHVEAALALYQQLNDPRLIASALIRLASLAERTGDYERGVALLKDAIQFAQQIDDDVTIARALLTLGLIVDLQGDSLTAKTYFEQALTILVKTGYKTHIGTTLLNLGWVTAELGEYHEALRYHQQAVALYRELRYPARISAALCNTGYLHIQLGQLENAEHCLCEALSIARDVYNTTDMIDILMGIGWLGLRRGDPERCAQIVGMALANPPNPPYPERQSFLDMVLPDLHAALSPQALQTALDTGASLDPALILNELIQS